MSNNGGSTFEDFDRLLNPSCKCGCKETIDEGKLADCIAKYTGDKYGYPENTDLARYLKDHQSEFMS